MFEISVVSIILILKGILQMYGKTYSWTQTLKFLIQWPAMGSENLCLKQVPEWSWCFMFDLTLLQFMKSLKISETIVISGIKVIHRKLLNIFFLPLYFSVSFLFFMDFLFLSSLLLFFYLIPTEHFPTGHVGTEEWYPFLAFRPINRIFLEFR